MKSKFKWAATAVAVVAVAVVAFTGTNYGPSAQAAGPEATAFDVAINGGGAIGGAGAPVAVRVDIAIDGGGLPPSDVGFFDITRTETPNIANQPGAGFTGGPAAPAAVGAQVGDIDFSLKTNVLASLIGSGNMITSGPGAGQVPECGSDPTMVNAIGSFTMHNGNMTREVGHTAAGLPTGLFASSSPAFASGEYPIDGAPGVENTLFIQTYDDDNRNGIGDSQAPDNGAPDEPAGPFLANPHPYATGSSNAEYIGSGHPQTQEDYDDDGKPNGQEYMPDFLPVLADALGLRAFWTSRSYGIANVFPGLLAPTDVHFMGFQAVPGVGGVTFTVLANPFSPANPASQATITCTPFTTTVDLQSTTTDAAMCSVGCTPLGVTAGTDVARVTVAGAGSVNLFISDDDDYDLDGVVGPVEKCAYDDDNADPDGDMTSGACDRDGAVYKNNEEGAALATVGVSRSASADNDGSGAVDVTPSIATLVANSAACKTGGNGICDNDIDGDRFTNGVDNCETVPNDTQRDDDGDGAGDEPGCDSFVAIDLLTGFPSGAGDGTATQNLPDTNATDIDNDQFCGDAYPSGGPEATGDGVPCTDRADSSDDAIIDTAAAGVSDEDGDGTSDNADSAPLQPLVGGTAALSPPTGDYDRDGCPNNADTMPKLYWNNFDNDGLAGVDLSDTIEILGFFGAGPNDPGVQMIDRAMPNAASPLVVIEANDGIDLTDAINSLGQFGFGCANPPIEPPPAEGEYVQR